MYLYYKASTLQGWNYCTHEFDRDIGLGLFSYRNYKVDDIITYYIGQYITIEAYNDLSDSTHGRYCLQVNDCMALDCYSTFKDNTCLASYANSYHNSQYKTTKTTTIANASIEVTSNDRIRIVAKDYIKANVEIIIDYGDHYFQPMDVEMYKWDEEYVYEY
jgi:hypothetical protein